MKVHMRQSDEPLSQGGTIVAECGKEVPNARFVMMWDAAECGTDFMVPVINMCRNCDRTEYSKRYVFGIVNGQEMRTQQNEL